MIKVLILDDDSVFATLLADFLNKRAGEFSAIATSTADKALEAARQAATAVPFDVFLIDQRLGPGPDGIKVMVKLRGICPDAEAIIFANDPQSGMQAYEAGAYRYLSKPFSREEMLWIVQSANDHRKTRSERDWHRLLNVVAEEAQRAQTFEEVAQIAVQSGRAFGFERARFWPYQLTTSGFTYMTRQHGQENEHTAYQKDDKYA